MNPIKIMTVSDDIFAGTGFSEEMKNILFRFAALPEYEVHWVSLQHTGYSYPVTDSMIPDIPSRGATIWKHGATGNADQMIRHHFAKIKPDIIFNVGDPHHFMEYIWMRQKEAFTFIGYSTLDGIPLHPSWKKIFDQVDVPMCMTEWANYEFLKAGWRMGGYVHHGLDWNWWQTNDMRKRKLKTKYGLEDYTIFGNWDTNQFRKRDSALLRAWKLANPEGKKMKLFLNKDSNCRLGNNLEALIEQYDVPRETVILPEDLSPTGEKKYFDQAEPPIEHKTMCELFDVYVSATGGEGFGKCSLEAHGLGIPTIIGKHSACQEVNAKGSVLIPVTGYYRPRDEVKAVDLALIDEEKMAEAIVYLYNNPEERNELGAVGRDFAKEFDYDTKIFPAWKDVIGRINPDVMIANELLKITH